MYFVNREIQKDDNIPDALYLSPLRSNKDVTQKIILLAKFNENEKGRIKQAFLRI